MGKRGPAPKGEYADKSQVLSTRIRADTREALERASKESGCSLSQEIEHRLRRSFDHDQKILDIFGDRQFYAIVRLISATMDGINNPVRGGSWRNDPYAYDQMIIAVNAVLAALRPAGEPNLKPLEAMGGEAILDDPIVQLQAVSLPFQGALRAEAILNRIAEADPALPVPAIQLKGLINVLRKRVDPIPYIRDDLGPLADRIKAGTPATDEVRRRTDAIIDANLLADPSIPNALKKNLRRRYNPANAKRKPKSRGHAASGKVL